MLLNGDCIEEMQKLIDEGVQVDSIVTDPPYHLQSIVDRFGKEGSAPAKFGTDGAFKRASTGFMGKEWDGGDIAFRKETWELAYKLLKPGGHLLAFSASRNYHRMAVAIEDAGFEIRDQIMWIYGSGFPKSLNIGKGVDKKLGNKREVVKNDSMKGAYLGPKYENETIEKELIELKAKYKKLDDSKLISTVAEKLADQKTVGWFQGRMEFGPRALGSRSILADPKSEKMQKELNIKIKFRESFRPFAPSVLSECITEYFEIDRESPYMLLVANIQKNKRIEMTKDEKYLFGIESFVFYFCLASELL